MRHLSTSLGLVEAGLGFSALPVWQCPCALFFDYWYPTGGTRYTSDIGIIRRKDAVLSPAAERFFALLINLWTDDKDNLSTISSNARDMRYRR
ncbi:hypothetical protein ACLK1T_02870 [Escherichia coli]